MADSRRKARAAKEQAISPEAVQAAVDYDPETGNFTRRYGGVRRSADGLVGWIDANGYRVLTICGTRVMAHRIAWVCIHGRWPAWHIDHVNGDKGDNRIANLREANHSQNMQNQGKNSRNTSGLKGAYWDKSRGKWLSLIGSGGKYRHLGRFDTAEEAHDAYCRAAAEMHGEFANLG